jgi:hypothetical protein
MKVRLLFGFGFERLSYIQTQKIERTNKKNEIDRKKIKIEDIFKIVLYERI